jgi:hypothetical protein
MPTLYDRFWTRDELLRRVGDIQQIGGIRDTRLQGGHASGVRALECNCGDGLRFTVLADRCLDIPRFEFRGVPLVWCSRDGIVAPTYYDARGSEWLHSFAGGLFTTCGLRQVGQPCVDEGEELGLHGRIANTPAEDVTVSETWDGDNYVLSVSGTMRETKIFSEDLRLTRTITTRMGERSLALHDRVRNLGSASSPFMLLYHVNIGFPVLDEHARLVVADRAVQPKDDLSRAHLAECKTYGPPDPRWLEQNFWHDVQPDTEGRCAAAIVNDHLDLPFGRGLGLAIRWRRDQLWNLVHWKQLGEGDYVTAIEPANCHTLGRCAERDRGTLEYLAPGEVRDFEVTFSVLVGADELQEFESTLPAPEQEYSRPASAVSG